MSVARADTADEVIEEMESKMNENEQREILARLRHSRERLPFALVSRVSELMETDPDTYRSTFLHINIYNRILDMDEASVKRLIAHFATRYLDPDWEAATLVFRSRRMQEEEQEIQPCATSGCHGDGLRSGLCFKCREREPETVLLEKLDARFVRVMVRQ